MVDGPRRPPTILNPLIERFILLLPTSQLELINFDYRVLILLLQENIIF